MKKIIAVLISAVMLLSLCACGKAVDMTKYTDNMLEKYDSLMVTYFPIGTNRFYDYYLSKDTWLIGYDIKGAVGHVSGKDVIYGTYSDPQAYIYTGDDDFYHVTEEEVREEIFSLLPDGSYPKAEIWKEYSNALEVIMDVENWQEKYSDWVDYIGKTPARVVQIIDFDPDSLELMAIETDAIFEDDSAKKINDIYFEYNEEQEYLQYLKDVDSMPESDVYIKP